MVTPAKDVKQPLQRSLWAIDPRDGSNYLDGVVMIGSAPMGPGPNPLAFPNGIRDADEFSWAGAITDFSVLHEDLTPRLSPATVEIEATTQQLLQKMFGAQIDVRFGAYAPTEGKTRVEEDVALDFAHEGFRRMVLTRETTDNNNYANNFMTKGFVQRALCMAGLKDQFQYQQSRQVGRTPEYNTMLLHVASKHLYNLKPGADVAVLYTTYGLPFPDRQGPGPFSAPHPWSKEVYHENAYNNYIAFKRYLEAYFGSRYALHFNPVGKSGDKRLDNYFSYGLSVPADFTAKDTDQKFLTLRQNIDQAKREGRKNIIAVLSHWYYNGRDPLLAVIFAITSIGWTGARKWRYRQRCPAIKTTHRWCICSTPKLSIVGPGNLPSATHRIFAARLSALAYIRSLPGCRFWGVAPSIAKRAVLPK